MLYIGADHGGYALKERLKERLERAGIRFVDVGATKLNPNDDYPAVAATVSAFVASGTSHTGILLCRSGVGVSIAANKVRGIRAVLAADRWTAQRARRDESANMLCLAAERLTPASAWGIITAWRNQKPRRARRDLRRLRQIIALERGR